MISELAARVFQTRNIAHIEHWQTDSYAAHVALGAFYDDVTKSIDAVVENYQGMFGKIKSSTIQMPTAPIKDIAAYLQDEADWIETHCDEIAQGSASIANLIQSLVSVYTKTVFLLSLK